MSDNIKTGSNQKLNKKVTMLFALLILLFVGLGIGGIISCNENKTKTSREYNQAYILENGSWVKIDNISKVEFTANYSIVTIYFLARSSTYIENGITYTSSKEQKITTSIQNVVLIQS